MTPARAVAFGVLILASLPPLTSAQVVRPEGSDPESAAGSLSVKTDKSIADSDYVKALILRISDRWLQQMKGTTDNPIVQFVLTRDGRLTNVHIERSSGVYSVDQAAVKAVERVSPFEPFPANITRPSVVVHLTFTPRRFITAEESGQIEYLNTLGLRQVAGDRERRDPQAAIRSFEQAAEMGDARAMANLGFLYEMGLGVTKDEKLAARWYLRAAELDSEVAALNLARMYESGFGVPRDPAEALRWYRGLTSSSKVQIVREAREGVDRLSR
jgi:TonB family protein